MEEKDSNFFKKICTSIKDFEGYEEFAAGKISKAIKYLLLITLIFTAFITIAYTYKFNLVIHEVKNYINENIEEISIVDGKLKVKSDKEIVIENENNIVPIIIVDTDENVDKDKYMEKIKAYNTGILFLSDRAVIVSNLINNDENIYYSNIFDSNIEGKGELLSLISTQNMIYSYGLFGLTILVYLFIVYFTSNLIDAVVLGVLGYLFARIMKLRLKYKATFNIGIHALTLPIILNLVYIIINTFTGFEINYFQWMYTSISYIYVVVAILMIKTEIINQKIQLIKLQEIQEKVAEEAEEELPQDKEKEDKQDEEDKKDEETTGEEPEGSKA